MADFWVVPEPVRVAVARRVCAERGLTYREHWVSTGLWMNVEAENPNGAPRFVNVYDWQVEPSDWAKGGAS